MTYEHFDLLQKRHIYTRNKARKAYKNTDVKAKENCIFYNKNSKLSYCTALDAPYCAVEKCKFFMEA